MVVESTDLCLFACMIHQIFYALVDQTLFGEQPCPTRDTNSIVADLKRQYTSWNHVEGTHWQIRFSHLINYGAGMFDIQVLLCAFEGCCACEHTSMFSVSMSKV